MGSLSLPTTLELESSSPEHTRRLGEALGRVLQPGDFVGLIGDLGAGKTELVRGIAQGIGAPADEVTSPSFALVNLYQGRIPLHHVDLFRLTSRDELYAAGYDDLLSGESVVVVEWVEKIPSAAPSDALIIRIDGAGKNRRLEIESRGPRAARLLADWRAQVGS